MRVSVIIPVYNVEPYLCETLQSLKTQTMQDFEVLLVDDHGTDRSIEVARAFTAGDARFRYLQTPHNGGPGVARNVGIEAAQGDYIAFIDGDDLYAPTFLEKLLSAATHDSTSVQDAASSSAKQRGIDLSYCQLQYRGGKRDGEVHRNPVVTRGEFSPSAKNHFLCRFVTFSVCFLFRREFLIGNDLRFPSRRNSEDTNFLTRCLLLAQTIACVDEPLYYYCVRQESLTTGRNSRRYKERLAAVNALMRDFGQLKHDPRHQSLQLSQYNLPMGLIWLKKGLAQSLLEIIKNFIHR